MKKYLSLFLIAAIAVQLFVPSYMIFSKYNTLKNGEQYKFKAYPVDPYDPFRGRYVQFSVNDVSRKYSTEKYGIISIDENGFAHIKEFSDEKPIDKPYIESLSDDFFSMPVDRYYMEDKLAPAAENLVAKTIKTDDVYITVRVLGGDVVVEGLFINGVAIEDLLKANSAES